MFREECRNCRIVFDRYITWSFVIMMMWPLRMICGKNEILSLAVLYLASSPTSFSPSFVGGGSRCTASLLCATCFFFVQCWSKREKVDFHRLMSVNSSIEWCPWPGSVFGIRRFQSTVTIGSNRRKEAGILLKNERPLEKRSSALKEQLVRIKNTSSFKSPLRRLA